LWFVLELGAWTNAGPLLVFDDAHAIAATSARSCSIETMPVWMKSNAISTATNRFLTLLPPLVELICGSWIGVVDQGIDAFLAVRRIGELANTLFAIGLRRI
jgi:hypothetical protein